MIGLGKTKASGIIAAKPTNHIQGAIAAIARPPSSGTTGSRLNRFRKKPVKASARQRSLPVACQMRMQAAAPMLPEHRAGEPDPGLGQRVVAQRARADHRAEEGDEHRRAGLDPLAPQLDHVAHLVDEQQHDEPGRERQAPDRGVGGDRDEHRAGRGQQLQLRAGATRIALNLARSAMIAASATRRALRLIVDRAWRGSEAWREPAARPAEAPAGPGSTASSWARRRKPGILGRMHRG